MTMRILSWPAKGRRPRGVLLATAAAGIAGLLAAVGPLSASGATADAHGGQRPWFLPGNLVLSGSYYTGQADLFTPGVTELPPGCTGSGCTAAVADGSYPYVFNNDASDPSFGVTSPVFLDQITPDGRLVNVLRVPDGNGPGGTRADHVVTSFSSKSELALNLSTDGRDLTFMGYYATPNTVDASNANTPGAIDPTNPVTSAYYRVAAEVNQSGRISYTLTNAYSGDNGRAAILNNSGGDNVLYMAGNAGNGSNPQPDGIISGTGAQITTPQRLPETSQTPGAATPVGSFNVTQLGDTIDKVGKDTNFRGLTIYNNVVYYTKGSGSNGINTVYFIDTTGKACPSGVGVPQPGARLPTSPIDYNPALLQSEGVTPYNMCILKGLPTTLAKSASEDAFPFGLFFANADTAVRGRRGERDCDLRPGDRQLLSGGRADHGRPAEVGIQRHAVEPRLHAQHRPEPRPAVQRGRLPDRRQRRHRAAVGAGDRRAAQHHRPRQPERHGHDLGGHVDGVRQRRPGRGPEQAGRDHRQAVGRRAPGRRAVRHRAVGRLRRGAARRVLHPGQQHRAFPRLVAQHR